MNRKYIIVSISLILAGFATGWETAALHTAGLDESFRIAQAIPVIRYEHFDASRNALMIALFNPGRLPVEVDRTALTYQTSSHNPEFTANTRDYGDKPLVLDPGDTILIPLEKPIQIKTQSENDRLWGELEFRIPGREDLYWLRHRFNLVSMK